MTRLIQLNFPPYRFKVSQQGEGLRIWDGLRGMWLVLTPEEWVRQHLVTYLIEECRAPAALVRQECPVLIEGTNQRADIVVYGNQGAPLLLAECKAPDVDINAAVFAQAVRYNSVLGAHYILVSNGLKHFIHERDHEGRYRAITIFPDLGL